MNGSAVKPRLLLACVLSCFALPSFAGLASDMGTVQATLASDVGTAAAVAFALAALVVVADVTIKWFKKYAKKGT